MNQNGFEPRNMPGYSYGQPNASQQNIYPGAGVFQGGVSGNAGGFQASAPAIQQSQVQSSPAFAFTASQTGNGYPPLQQTPAGGYPPIQQTPVGGYPPIQQTPVGGYPPIQQTPAGGYPPIQQTPAGGYSQLPPASTGGYSTVSPSNGNGYGGYAGQPSPVIPTGSFIPRTPYSPGYTSPGYQPGYQKPAANGYPQGYSAYAQMGRVPQNTAPQQQQPAQMPLNGGGYVPQKVNIRRRPLEQSDILLLAAGGTLIILFVIAMITQLAWLKWLFLIPAVGSIALLWLKSVTAANKRLCYTIVIGALSIAMFISILSSPSAPADKTKTPSSGSGSSVQDVTQSNSGGIVSSGGIIPADDRIGYGVNNYPENATPTPSPASEINTAAATRIVEFFSHWSLNELDEMLELTSPAWRVKQENAKKSLFTLLQNRTPVGQIRLVNDPGPSAGDSLQFLLQVTISRNNGKPAETYQMNVRMVSESGQWYVDPNSLLSNEIQETPDPKATPVPTPTPEPTVDANTILYYNPDGGKLYHLDPNCVSVHSKYTPLKGRFTYSQINDGKYASLDPCNVCAAPLRVK